MRLVFPILALALACLCSMLLLQLRSAHERIATLEKELASSSQLRLGAAPAAPLAEPIQSAPNSEVAPVPQAPPAQAGRSETGSREDDDLQRARFLASQDIEEIKKLTALSDTEQEELTRALEGKTVGAGTSALFFSREESDLRLREALTEVLGQQRTDDFFSRREAEEQRQRAGRLELQVGTLARRLSLSVAQEQSIRAPLEELNANAEMLRQGLRAKMRELTVKHFSADANAEELRQGFEQMKQAGQEIKDTQRELLNQKLRPLLNDDQFNALLAEQGTSPETLFGIPGL